MGNNIEIILLFYFSQYKCDIAVIKKNKIIIIIIISAPNVTGSQTVAEIIRISKA